MALEKPGKLGVIFSYFVATLPCENYSAVEKVHYKVICSILKLAVFHDALTV